MLRFLESHSQCSHYKNGTISYARDPKESFYLIITQVILVFEISCIMYLSKITQNISTANTYYPLGPSRV